jgi:6-phosphogluconolactonase
MIVYIGTYTQKLPHVQGNAEGIYCYELNLESGALTLLGVTPEIVNPSFVAPVQNRLFAVQEIGAYDPGNGVTQPDSGGVNSFALNREDWTLTPISAQATHGAHPCFVSTDQSGHWLFVANYSGGSIAVLQIGADGALGPASSVIRHDGPHPHHDGPHPHAIVQTPEGRYVLVPDCGLDRVYVYRFNPAIGALEPNDPPWATLAPGAGPRHLAFHSSGRVYVINERNSTLSAFAYDAERGILHEIQTLSTLPAGFSGNNSCADIHIHPEGRFLYGSNRGHDSIAIFAIHPTDGTLTLLGHTPSGGRTPRNFAIDPGGTLLLAANQDSSTIAAFRINSETGLLTTIRVNDVPTPVCVRFVID